jgi:FixJ family two-component response regulator
MPQMAGTELAQLLANDRPELPIVFMSGYAAGEVDHEQFNNAKFLQKPFTLTAMTDIVCEGLRTCPRLRQIQS